MKGYIKIEAVTYEGHEGLYVESGLEHVSNIDRMQVLHSLCRSLEITPAELKLMAMLMQKGIMDEVAEVKSKDKPDVHIIGGDATDMIKLLKMLLQ